MNGLCFNLLACFFIFNICAASEVVNYPKHYYVGEIGAQWDFPSDHLPVGASIGNVHFAFWNILNKNAIFHLENNLQGLLESSLISNNVALMENETITIREILILEMIVKMIEHRTHPRSLIALSEVHRDVIRYLDEILPINWKLISPTNSPSCQNVFIYDSNIFEFVDFQSVNYTLKPSQSIMTLVLKEKKSQNSYKFIQSHIPGGPFASLYSIKEFAYEVFQQYNPKMTIVVMGDMNTSPKNIAHALTLEANTKKIFDQPFQYYPTDYPTHIDTNMYASWIDNLFVHNPSKMNHEITVSNDPEELFDELIPIITILKDLEEIAKSYNGISSKVFGER